MKRIDIKELHERPWVPGFLRDYMTDALQFVMGVAGVYRPIVGRLSGAVDAAGAHRIARSVLGRGRAVALAL